jgi:hypothetical protein
MSIVDSKMGGFDIISSITQITINDQFRAMKRAQIIPDHLDIKLPRGLGNLKVHLLAPTVVLGVDAKSPKQILFKQHFSSGVFNTIDDDGVAKEIPFGEGAFAFKVDIDMSQIAPADAPPSVRDAIAHRGEGLFTMRQLYVIFDDAAIVNYDAKHTTLPQALVDDDVFKIGLASMFKAMHAKGGSIIGYSVTVKNPNDVTPEAPTLPPTDIDFSTHIYIDPKDKSSNPELDAFNYLMMTRNAHPPGTSPTGNFVEGGSAGTMAVSRSSFVEGYLLPTIAARTNLTTTISDIDWNRAATNITKGGSFVPVAESDKSTFESLSAQLRTETNNLIENWSVMGTPVPIRGVISAHADSTANRWRFISMNGKDKINYGWPAGGYNTVFVAVASHLCEVCISPGENTISLRGLSMLGRSWDAYLGIPRASMTFHELHGHVIKFEWTATITLIADSSGRLAPKVEFVSQPITVEGDINWLGKITDYTYPAQAKDEMDRMHADFDRTFEGLSDAIRDALSGGHGFVFPGGHQYFFRDLIFNKDLDLLATLTIKFQ